MEQNRNLQRLKIIGTTHVDKSSVERVRVSISETRPSMVAVELDDERLWALRDPHRDKLDFPVRLGLLPWLMSLLERSVGSLTEVFPGSEMLEAIDEAQKVGAEVIMIDKPIGTIVSEIRGIPLLEKVKIGFDILFALFAIGTKRGTTQLAETGLNALMAEFDARYPTLSRILVKERDRYMADRLREILRSTTGQVIAVVGLGHVNGIMQDLAINHQTPSADNIGSRYEWTIRGSS